MPFLKRSQKLCDRFVNPVKESPDDSGSSSWVLISCLSTPGWPACIYQQFRQQREKKLYGETPAWPNGPWTQRMEQPGTATLQPKCQLSPVVPMETALPRRYFSISVRLRGEAESVLSPPEREALMAEKTLRYFQINCTRQRTLQPLYQIEKTIKKYFCDQPRYLILIWAYYVCHCYLWSEGEKLIQLKLFIIISPHCSQSLSEL